MDTSLPVPLERTPVSSYGVYDAKTQLPRLLARVEAGEEIVLCRRGRPIARLVPERAPFAGRIEGRSHPLIRVHPDFDGPLVDEVYFTGGRR